MTDFFYEYQSRIEVVVWCFHVNMLTNNRYLSILNDQEKFNIVFQDAISFNPKIQHYIDNELVFSTTANTIRNEYNFNLLKAWTILAL